MSRFKKKIIYKKHKERGVLFINGKSRPNKLALGMTYTAERSHHRLTDTAVSLAVNGTCDPLRSHRFAYGKKRFVRTVCPCCRARTGPFRLEKNLNQ